MTKIETWRLGSCTAQVSHDGEVAQLHLRGLVTRAVLSELIAYLARWVRQHEPGAIVAHCRGCVLLIDARRAADLIGAGVDAAGETLRVPLAIIVPQPAVRGAALFALFTSERDLCHGAFCAQALAQAWAKRRARIYCAWAERRRSLLESAPAVLQRAIP